MSNFSLLKPLTIVLIALVVWLPLKPYGVTDFSILGFFELNWIAALMGLGAFFLVNDFKNFQGDTKFKYFLIAAFLCPFWTIARFCFLPKK